MAMTACPQCDGEMSNYALSCPHCGRMNPAAPQAILLQEKREKPARIPQNVVAPSISVEAVMTVITDVPVVKKESDLTQWIEDICVEWRGLTPFIQHVIQVLFGCAIFAVVGLWIYAVLS